MTSLNALGTVGQVAGLLLAPLLPGMVQRTKAHLQGRRGASIVQPYRELRRLWRKSVVQPEDTTLLYRLAPSICAAAIACAVLLIPVAGGSSRLIGADMVVLVGLLALARFTVTTSAFDPGGGFGLMGASRDLMFGVFAEPMLLLALALMAVQAGSTSLLTMASMSGDAATLASPAHWSAALALSLAVLVETGRQPIDNPDTHLELTMVHEGPLLEYAGRDLAMLQWAAAARHWVVLVLLIDLFIPTAGNPLLDLAVLAGSLVVACVVLAIVESSVAKLRILRVPALLGTGLLVGLVGLASLAVGH